MADYDLTIRGARIYDGSGGAPIDGDVAVTGDRIARVGRFCGLGTVDIDARGLAASPGFVNMLSWANVSLIADGRSISRPPRLARRFVQRGLVCRRDHRTGARHREMRTARPVPLNSCRCENSSARQWKKARSASRLR